MATTLEEMQGNYDIRYSSKPQMPDWYEAGVGSARIEGYKLIGHDAHGASWNADFQINVNGKISYTAIVDPSKAPPGNGVLNKNGQMTREPQSYAGEIGVTKHATGLILRTKVQQGPLTIDVQFIKK